jgi:hypothetical protein
VGWLPRGIGDTEATVEVGPVLVGVVLPAPLVGELLALPVELPPAGVGDTMATVEVGDEVVAVVELVEDDVLDEDVEGDGVELSFGTPLANGLRAIRANTTLAGSFESEWPVVPV